MSFAGVASASVRAVCQRECLDIRLPHELSGRPGHWANPAAAAFYLQSLKHLFSLILKWRYP